MKKDQGSFFFMGEKRAVIARNEAIANRVVTWQSPEKMMCTCPQGGQFFYAIL